jgi:hypothetical protein
MKKCIFCESEKQISEFRGNRKKCRKCENKVKKPKYEFRCSSCKCIYYATKQNEKKKKFTSMCSSCSISFCWSEDEYRKVHTCSLKEAHNKEEAKAKHSAASKRRFESKEYKEEAIRRLSTKESRFKAIKSIKENWADSKKSRIMLASMFRTRNQNISCSKGEIQVKSGYEKRLIIFLDKEKLSWEYEPQSFHLRNMNKVYIPDFYIKELDLWIEVKGYWYKDAKEKWNNFLLEYPHLKKCLILKHELEKIENGAKIEDFIY